MEENLTDSWTEKERQQAYANAMAIKAALEKKNAEVRKKCNCDVLIPHTCPVHGTWNKYGSAD